MLSAGALADRYGRRRAFMAGLGLFTASSAVCAAARRGLDRVPTEAPSVIAASPARVAA